MLNLPVKSYELPNGATINRDGTAEQEYWTVTHFGFRLSRNGDWDYQPVPSERSLEWILEHAFKTPEEAYIAFVKSANNEESQI